MLHEAPCFALVNHESCRVLPNGGTQEVTVTKNFKLTKGLNCIDGIYVVVNTIANANNIGIRLATDKDNGCPKNQSVDVKTAYNFFGATFSPRLKKPFLSQFFILEIGEWLDFAPIVADENMVYNRIVVTAINYYNQNRL